MKPIDMTEITLHPDQKAVAWRHIKDAQLALATISSILSGGTMPQGAGLYKTAISLVEHRMADFGKLLGIPTQSEADIEERHATVRAGNIRIRELEAQLGKEQSPEFTKMGLKLLDERINDWWKLEGFGHVSEVSFGAYRCTAKLSCHLFGNFSVTQSDTPISDKERKVQWRQSLRDRGFVLTDGDRNISVLDCDASRKTLMDLIRKRLPSAIITNIENGRCEGDHLIMRDVEVSIPDFGEILALPGVIREA